MMVQKLLRDAGASVGYGYRAEVRMELSLTTLVMGMGMSSDEAEQKGEGESDYAVETMVYRRVDKENLPGERTPKTDLGTHELWAIIQNRRNRRTSGTSLPDIPPCRSAVHPPGFPLNPLHVDLPAICPPASFAAPDGRWPPSFNPFRFSIFYFPSPNTGSAESLSPHPQTMILAPVHFSPCPRPQYRHWNSSRETGY